MSLAPLHILVDDREDRTSVAMRLATSGEVLLTLGIVFDLQILRAMDEAETARILLLAARQICRSARSSIRRPGWRPRAKRARQLFILTSLPGVGATRALALLNHFGSIERVLSASQADLLGIEGIGPRTAIAIRDAVSEDLTSYK